MTPYLAADAARLADADLPPVPVPVQPVTDTVLQELEYAGHLFQRAQEAIDRELQVLAAAGIRFAGTAALRATTDLSQLTAQVRMQAMLARAGRAA